MTTATCFWSYGSRASVQLTVRTFSDAYTASVRDFAMGAVQDAARSNSGTVGEVAGIGDYAAITYPKRIGPSLAASFYAAKDRAVIQVTFMASRTSVASNWPTMDQLKTVGEAAVRNIF